VRFRAEKIGAFLDAAYSLEGDDEAWLAEVMRTARAVWGRGGPAHGTIYDASDPAAFRVPVVHFIDCPRPTVDVLMDGLALITPALVRRTFHRISAGCFSGLRLRELEPMVDGMSAFGYHNALNINGVDPSGLGVYFALWAEDPDSVPRDELAIYRRLGHHLGAAYRCRRRLRDRQVAAEIIDATVGAEAIIDARQRVLYAAGEARTAAAQSALQETAAARDDVRRRRGDVACGLARWRPLTGTRWTLIDAVDRGGTRYVVARENRAEVGGLAALSDRERQVVAYLAVGQSTKETAYALGIADVTVRVLLRRAAGKLGVPSREALLAHPEVSALPMAEGRGDGD